MAQHDVIVVGASSGGVAALTQLVGGLPADLPAAIFVVLHVNPDAPSQLPAILNRAGRLPAAHAVDGEPMRRGRIYVAPPGLQMYLHQGRISVGRGPRENRHRPAIDPLFRTAAHHYGSRVIGIILSGALDDGTAGLLAVKEAGGVTIVQDPEDADFPDMPFSALEHVHPDYCVSLEEMPELLSTLAGTASAAHIDREVPLETVEESPIPSGAARSDQLGDASEFTCPECHGTLWEIKDGPMLRYRCRVGHAYSEHTMVEAQAESVERALWAALRALEERVALINKLADRARRRGHDAVAALFDRRATDVNRDVRALHELITKGRALEEVPQEPEHA